MPFDPMNLRADASMNRVVYGAPRASPRSEAVRGKRSQELLSVRGFGARIAARAGELGLTAAEVANGPDLPAALGRRLESQDGVVRGVAEELADERGEYLAHHIATLHRGDAASRAARAEWDESHWAWWAGIRRIVLGGGTVNGALGRRVAATARGWLQRWGVDVAVDVAETPGLLPLIGAARGVQVGARAALVMDFGNTGAKAAYARYEDGVLTGLSTLPTQATSQYTDPTVEDPDDSRLRAQAEFMVALMASHLRRARDAGLEPAPVIQCSLACYMAGNHPVGLYRGDYARLGILGANLGEWFSQRVSSALSEAVKVELHHDGTCAARTYAGAEHTAVLMMGTWMGVGFAGPADGLAAVKTPLAIDEA